MEKYQSIINYEYKGSSNRKKMSLNDRAAQFAPFAALTGYGESIIEESRLTVDQHSLSEDMQEELNLKLLYIKETKTKEEIQITYYIPDQRKQGGSYKITTKEIKKIDLYNNQIIFIDETKINIDTIIDIKSEELNKIFDVFVD